MSLAVFAVITDQLVVGDKLLDFLGRIGVEDSFKLIRY